MTEKQCAVCSQIKPLSEFNRHNNCRGGVRPECRVCKKAMERARWARRDKTHRKVITRKATLRFRYGITPEDYSAMLEAQGNVCAICRGTNAAVKDLAVDHDHKTGAVRGLLCPVCNTRLAVLDNAEWLAEAHTYLSRLVPMGLAYP